MAEIKDYQKERTGITGTNIYGSKMVVEKYNACRDIIVRFIETDELIKTTWKSFSNGTTKSVYDRTVFGVGYTGMGEYRCWIGGKATPQYDTWRAMISRCYSEKIHTRQPYYKVCTVTEEWHNYQNFAMWYDQNYYKIEGQRMHLDKDILVKGNKVYSPDTCVFVPQSINSLFIKKQTRENLPVGVGLGEGCTVRPYVAFCNNGNGKQVRIGSFHSAMEAFGAYKRYKEDLIKKIAEEYKWIIPQRLYEAMINYEIEIS